MIEVPCMDPTMWNEFDISDVGEITKYFKINLKIKSVSILSTYNNFTVSLPRLTQRVYKARALV